jgi:hypothetical protein
METRESIATTVLPERHLYLLESLVEMAVAGTPLVDDNVVRHMQSKATDYWDFVDTELGTRCPELKDDLQYLHQRGYVADFSGLLLITARTKILYEGIHGEGSYAVQMANQSKPTK